MPVTRKGVCLGCGGTCDHRAARCFKCETKAREAAAIEHFWASMDKSGPPHPKLGTPCWVFTGPVNKRRGGYGTIKIAGKRWRAHRLAWAIGQGQIPDGLDVLHHCDNPPCCNYETHLFTGTDLDNSRDAAAKGRLNAQKHPERYAGALARAQAARLAKPRVQPMPCSRCGRLYKPLRRGFCHNCNEKKRYRERTHGL